MSTSYFRLAPLAVMVREGVALTESGPAGGMTTGLPSLIHSLLLSLPHLTDGAFGNRRRSSTPSLKSLTWALGGKKEEGVDEAEGGSVEPPLMGRSISPPHKPLPFPTDSLFYLPSLLPSDCSCHGNSVGIKANLESLETLQVPKRNELRNSVKPLDEAKLVDRLGPSHLSLPPACIKKNILFNIILPEKCHESESHLGSVLSPDTSI